MIVIEPRQRGNRARKGKLNGGKEGGFACPVRPLDEDDWSIEGHGQAPADAPEILDCQEFETAHHLGALFRIVVAAEWLIDGGGKARGYDVSALAGERDKLTYQRIF
jgi:hypothetical protein